jgi:histidine ammonia-lyase
MTDALPLDGNSLRLAEVRLVARSPLPVRLADHARTAMRASRAWVEAAASGALVDADGASLPIYGVNTGFGSLARVRIPPEQVHALSMNLIRSHAAGVGPALRADQVRGMMLLRANALAKGASGCRPELVDTLCAMLTRGVTPEVPSQGSCGSSGDLAPLSHLGLVVFDGGDGDDRGGTGHAWYKGERLTGAAAMAAAGIPRLRPEPKEGLAITNGAQLSTAIAALAAEDAATLVLAAEIAAAMGFEALLGVTRALHPDVQRLRPYPGAIACAANLRSLLDGSNLVNSLPDKVQDAYALRCTPQVLGACRDGISFARRQIGIELNAATDNPVFLLDAEGDNKAFSAGLFHGEPVGLAADHLKLAVSELASLSERRIFRLTTGTLSSRLPALLADRPGIGLMVPQATAAALVSENKALAWPASADSIPTCEDQEDHVAMSTTAARRAADVVANSARVVAIELLSATHALRWRHRDADARCGIGTQAAMAAVTNAIAGADESPGAQIEAITERILDRSLVDRVRAVVALTEVADA